VTPVRVAVIELFLRQSCALSAADVLSGLQAHAPDRVTVYRTLTSLAGYGLIYEELSFDRVRRYLLGVPVPQSRVKFRCVACGAERTRSAAPLPVVVFPGCEITGQLLMLEGRCEDCRDA